MTTELQARLLDKLIRTVMPAGCDHEVEWLVDPDCAEAAAEIARLTSEVERLEGNIRVLAPLGGDVNVALNRLDKLVKADALAEAVLDYSNSRLSWNENLQKRRFEQMMAARENMLAGNRSEAVDELCTEAKSGAEGNQSKETALTDYQEGKAGKEP